MDTKFAKEFYIYEKEFDNAFLGKQESIMALGNGYLGLRSATEEVYLGETRNYFVAGTFNKADLSEVTELPNMADITEVEIILDGEPFRLTTGTIEKYCRRLCLRDGELSRFVRWVSPKGNKYELKFSRFVSLEELHVVAQKIQIKSLTKNAEIIISTGINGRMNNHGVQHFLDGEKRFYDQRYMQMVQETTESKIRLIHNTVVKINGSIDNALPSIAIERRKLFCNYKENLIKGQELTIEKISNVYTTRDKENQKKRLKEIQENSLKKLKIAAKKGYDKLIIDSKKAWEEKLWNLVPINIETDKEADKLALRFAQYHLQIMTPAHDNRMSIAAKGLTGEGYKGHTFWDTDIYILPYYVFMMPEIARNLLEYRYLSLDGARKKARENGYEGAQYPWESAWIDDGEVTPSFGVVNVETGMPTRIYSGIKELHITADVAYGVWIYYKATGDHDFMDKYGYEMIFDTAKFWASRLEYHRNDQKYHLSDVIGPDEYKEHVDDNAFTNFMAFWNIKKAIKYFEYLKDEKEILFKKLDEKLKLEEYYKQWYVRVEKMYLPKSREKDKVIPQDRTYLTLEEVDLKKYKNQSKIATILEDYSINQISKIQVSKQTDTLLLFLLLEELFTKEEKKANWKYYEPKTLHDSSLSLSAHCILACDMKNEKLAYELFEKACQIDLSEKSSSDEGIHAAAMGGIWQCIVYGFGGVRVVDGKLRIEPQLPKKWRKIEFELNWKNQKLFIRILETGFIVQNIKGDKDISFIHKEKEYWISKAEVCEVKIKEKKEGHNFA